MTAGKVAAVAAVTLALQTMLTQLLPAGLPTVDLVLVGVVYVALTSGSVTGLLVGTFAGLAQDALSSGTVGIGGLAKSLVGYLAGRLGTQLIVAAALPRFVAFFTATLVHALVFIGLYRVLDLREFPSPYVGVVEQAAGNAVVGVVAFQVVEFLPGALERRRMAKSRLRR